MPDQADYPNFLKLRTDERDSAAENPHLRDWTDSNSKRHATPFSWGSDEERREVEGGMRIVAYGLLAVTFLLAVAIFKMAGFF